MSTAVPKLFSPIKVGKTLLKHRVVLAPLTRFRATRSTHVPVVRLVKEYYSQRGSVPGTLLITEATCIAAEAGGYRYAPGIWNKDQIKAWKEITDAVHAKGSYIFAQLWALGRAGSPSILAEEGNYPYVSASPIALSSSKSASEAPRALTLEEIDKYVDLYVSAARNAVEAGFDGVEIHGANGYLVDQFLQDVSNHRTDEYGGSVENRSRFGLRVVDAIQKAIGAERTAIRLSPWGRYQDMGMDDPVPQFSHFVSSLAKGHPDLAYIHLVEPTKGDGDVPIEVKPKTTEREESNDFIRDIWAPRPLITCSEYTRDTALTAAEKKGDIIGFGRLFIANPDLPYRLEHDLPLTTPDPKSFYTHSDEPHAAQGYIDYPFSREFEAQQAKNIPPKSRVIEFATYASIAGLVTYNIVSRL